MRIKKTIIYDGKDEVIVASTLTDLEKYILGAKGKGRKLSQILDFDTDDYEDYIIEFKKFKQDPTNLNSTIHEDIKISHLELLEKSKEYNIYIRY